MSVYVDALFLTGPRPGWPFTHACHMWADTEAELHALAGTIGLKRAWFQGDSALPHYDLTRSKRALAIRHGAIEATREQLVAALRARREEAQRARG